MPPILADGRPACHCGARYSQHAAAGGACLAPGCGCDAWSPRPPTRWADLDALAVRQHAEWHRLTDDGATVGRRCSVRGCPHQIAADQPLSEAEARGQAGDR